MKDFNIWLTTFLKEKELDNEKIYEIDHLGVTHLVERSVVVQTLLNAPANIKEKVKQKCVEIDFKNGSVDDFLRHLAFAIVRTRYEAT